MDIKKGDTIILKKPHPCGENCFLVIRAEDEFEISCKKCGRITTISRNKIKNAVKRVELDT